MIEYVSVEQLKEILEKKLDFNIIDVRELSEYQTARILNSILVPLSNFENDINNINKNKTNYFLCGVGRRALKAAEYLESIGYENLYVIDGGIKAWIEAGYLVERG